MIAISDSQFLIILALVVNTQPKIDFYDPFPETSGGLVRPFELLSLSQNPIDWFEFTATISAYFSLSIEIGEDFACFQSIMANGVGMRYTNLFANVLADRHLFRIHRNHSL